MIALEKLVEKELLKSGDGWLTEESKVVIENHIETNSITLDVYVHTHRGDAAKALYQITGNITYARESAYAYFIAAKKAKILSEKVRKPKRKISFAIKSYETYKLCSDITKEYDPEMSARTYGFMGEQAEMIAETIKNPERKMEWTKKAGACYKFFLDYYESHLEGSLTPKMIGTLVYISSRRREIESKTQQIELNIRQIEPLSITDTQKLPFKEQVNKTQIPQYL